MNPLARLSILFLLTTINSDHRHAMKQSNPPRIRQPFTRYWASSRRIRPITPDLVPPNAALHIDSSSSRPTKACV
ncbi:hypothetical protein V8C26DRAFT_230192 [Trichoderma gracile]